MQTGLLWQDLDQTKPLALKLIEAAKFYADKFGAVPGWAVVNPAEFPAGQGELAGLRIEAAQWMRPNHVWLGVKDG